MKIERHIDRRFILPRRNHLLAGLMIVMSMLLFGASGARAETRSLKLYFIHTGEKAEIVFKRNGRYDQAGLKKINQFLRDWRRNEPTRMDPRLMDLVWEAYRAVGARDYIHVVSAYRSPATNSMLRKRSKGVANKSQHMLGKAMDFYIPGVSLKKLRETGMKMQGGGVGYYPRSGSPFVHMDVGNVRHWPKMSRKELVALFPKGNTLHVPSDGKPLPGFDQAMASYQSRKKSGTTAIAMASGGKTKKPSTSLLAAFFGSGEDEEETADPAPVVKPHKAAPKPVVKTEPVIEQKPLFKTAPPPPEVEQVEVPPAPLPEEPAAPTPEAIIASLPMRAIPLPDIAPRPKADIGPAPMATASIPPQGVPFGQAMDPIAEMAAVDTEQPPEVPAEVLANVPMPSWRPAYQPQVAAVAEPAPPPAPSVAAAATPDVASAPATEVATAEETREADESLLLALASTGDDPLADTTALPTPRPTADDEEFPISALPETVTGPSMAPEAELADHDKAAVEAQKKANGVRVAALEAASPKLAIADRDPGTDPASVIGQGVKTTAKSARANRRDSKPLAKAVVLVAEPQAARWVLSKDYVAEAAQGTKAPSFAYNVVVTAPREVYTDGFKKGEQVADANRFTGKAVKFLSVARFE